MDDLNELLEVINFSKFIPKFTEISLNGGVKHRKAANKLNPEEAKEIIAGLGEFAKKVNTFVLIEKNKENG